MGDMTRNFSRWEFACPDKCGFDEIDERLVHRLQVVRDIMGLPIKINSGCRCSKHNKEVGGESVSFHLAGMAADWRFKYYDEELYFRMSVLLADWSGGFHYYPERRFFHCDIGPERRWQGV